MDRDEYLKNHPNATQGDIELCEVLAKYFKGSPYLFMRMNETMAAKGKGLHNVMLAAEGNKARLAGMLEQTLQESYELFVIMAFAVVANFAKQPEHKRGDIVESLKRAFGNTNAVDELINIFENARRQG